jgi:hypothetical protein
MRTLQSIATGLLALCLGPALAFAFDFPQLTGPAVDQAVILTAASRSDIAAKSIALQEKSGIQLVVATVRSLEDSDIETYANQLFRTWKLGQAQKNNGVLLLVAPAEHKVRIEVGYGDWQPQPRRFIIDTDKPGALNTALPILGFLAVAIILRLLIAGIAKLLQILGVVKPPGHYVKQGAAWFLCRFAVRRAVRQAGVTAIPPAVHPPTVTPAAAGRRAAAGHRGVGDAVEPGRP